MTSATPDTSRSNTPTDTSSRPVRVLFFAEAVTLAHVARPLVLAQGLPPDQFEPIIAVDPRYEKLYATSTIPRIAINSIPSAQFAAALAKGNPIYSARELEQYVQQDLEVIQSVNPDVIIGDMRLSLAASARLAGVPYLSLTNAYWSPFAQVHFPVPQTPMTRWLGVGISQVLFNFARPMVFAIHTRPLNRVLRNHKLPSLGTNLQRVYSDADHVLYADTPGLTPMGQLPENHHFIGPLLWEPDLPRPSWWELLKQNAADDATPDQTSTTHSTLTETSSAASAARLPIIYVNLGSSGPANLLAIVLEGLKDLPVTVIAATAGKVKIDQPPANARIADFLPGLQACALADVVICNGGSPSTQQAIASGKPILCLPSNLDQFLNTQGLLKAGVAKQVRADRVKADAVRQAVSEMLGQTGYQAAARKLMERSGSLRPHETLASVIARVI